MSLGRHGRVISQGARLVIAVPDGGIYFDHYSFIDAGGEGDDHNTRWTLAIKCWTAIATLLVRASATTS